MPFNLDYFVIFKYQPVYLMIPPPFFFNTHSENIPFCFSVS